MKRRIIRSKNLELDPTGYMGPPDDEKLPPVYIPDYQKASPWRHPAWRWERAERLREKKQKYNDATDDALTREALRFARVWDYGKRHGRLSELTERAPNMLVAHEVYREDGPTKWLLEARLLARQTFKEIGRAMSMSTRAVAWYQAWFFNVSDRLDASVYIQKQILKKPTPEDTDLLLKAFAYHGGPVVLDVVAPYLLMPEEATQPLSQARSKQATRIQQVVRLLTLRYTQDTFSELLDIAGEPPTDSQYAELRAALEKEIAMHGDVLRESEGSGCVNMVDRLAATQCDPSTIIELAEELKVSL